MSKFRQALQNLSSALSRIISHNLEITPNKSTNYLNFAEKKKSYEISFYQISYKDVINSVKELDQINTEKNKDYLIKIKSMISKLKECYETNDLNQMVSLLADIIDLELDLSYSDKSISLENSFKLPVLPKEIALDMKADAEDLQKCFNASAYRACVILCGRLLETTLHRKYFDATNNDLLEKSPGIGLGNLIAKLKESNVPMDPAIAQQIHLINQVRIFSVHTKKDPFYPTKDQTHAIILYTFDILKKLFT